MSCKPGPPDGVLGAGKMEDVLYDYHMAQAMAQQMPGDSIAYYTRLYQEAVFMKYGITQSDFDKSMIWYERHADKLGKYTPACQSVWAAVSMLQTTRCCQACKRQVATR